MYFKKLEGEKIYLAPMMVEDAKIFCKWLNDNSVTDGLNKTKDVTTIENEIEYLENVNKKGEYAFSIVKKEDDTLIGSCSINEIDFPNRAGTVGILIGDEENRGKGYGTDTLKTLLNYGFNELCLHNIQLGVYSFNERAIACYKKVGFKEVGRNREVRFHNGKWYDGILMDILDREFNK